MEEITVDAVEMKEDGDEEEEGDVREEMEEEEEEDDDEPVGMIDAVKEGKDDGVADNDVSEEELRVKDLLKVLL